jgi:undecaprenyl pyrophosphate synthase
MLNRLDKNSMDSINQIKQRNNHIKAASKENAPKLSYDKIGDYKNFNLNFISYEKGGRTLMVNTCKTIANKIKSRQLNVDDLSQDLIDTQILGI